MPLHTRVSGAWNEVEPSGFQVYQTGWQPVQTGYVKVAGVWEAFYQNSDERLYTFDATAINSSTGFGTTWNGSGDCKVGSYGFGDRVTYLEFFGDDTSGFGHTLAEALAIRPVVKGCSIDIRRTGGGFGTMNTGTWYFGKNSGTFGSGTGTCDATNRFTQVMSSFGWAQNTTHRFSGLGDLGGDLGANSISITNNLTPVTSGGGEDSDYTQVSSTLTDHTLLIRLDYV